MEFMENYIPLVEACFPWNLRKINSTSGILSSMEFVINYFHKWNLVFNGISTSGMFSFMEFMEKYFPQVESCFPYNSLKVIFHKWNMAFHRIYGKLFSTSGILFSMNFMESFFPLVESCFSIEFMTKLCRLQC